MRRSCMGWAAALSVLMVLGCAPASRGGVTLVRDGEAVAKILVWSAIEKPTDREVSDAEAAGIAIRADAVAELVEHIRLMSGATLDVFELGDPGGRGGVRIVLAPPINDSSDGGNVSPETFEISVSEDRVLVSGETDQALRHGVYELLRRLGCDWVMPGEIGMVVPKRRTVVVPKMHVKQEPSFFFRRLWYRGYPDKRAEESERFARWQLRHKGDVKGHALLGASGHVWPSFIKRHQEEFDKDPTMYALVRGADGGMERRGPQIEPTHPRVMELFVEEIRGTYEKHIAEGKWTQETTAGFGIGPADGMGYSESPEAWLSGSGRIDPIVGDADRTDALILLGNRILEQVVDDYPNAHVGFYSYSVHGDYPARYKPHPNIVQIFAPINFSRFHSLLDENSKTQSYYRRVLDQWGELAREQGNPLIYRGYNWNLADNMMPFSKVRIWGEELPYYHRLGFLGLNVEATKAWSVNGPSDYVFMRLAWDATLDWREVLQEYCEKAFGEGAEAMERYLMRIIETQHGSGQEAGSYHAFHLIYDEDWVAQGDGDLQAALAAAETDRQRQRVMHFKRAHEALALYLDYHAATRRFDFAGAADGYAAMIAHWQETYDWNSDLVATEVPQYLGGLVRSFVEESAKYSSGAYRMVQRIPDELVTMFDPTVRGELMNYHSPAINDSGFIKTRTFGSTWDAQGLTGMRSGGVWYRYRFTLPGDAGDEGIGLFLGGFEDEAQVWINGELVGSSGVRFSRPAVFDLTDWIDRAGENVLAVRVVRNSKANEIGLGGLIRPSFIFAGPRLERAAPAVLDLGRVLPGGERE